MEDEVTRQTPDLQCDQCAFATGDVKEAMRHLESPENEGHIVSGPGAFEGTTLTISVDPGQHLPVHTRDA